MARELIPPTHIGDGLYMIDNGFEVAIAVNHHSNVVATIDIDSIDRAIAYLQQVKENNLIK